MGNASVALVPLVILLAALAGIGVIVRCLRATGIERKQLQWRGAGARCPGTTVLVLTMYDDEAMVFQAVAVGASGYLLKGSDGPDIITAILAAAAGQAVFGATLAQRMQTWFARAPVTSAASPQLTERERQILDGVAAGLTNADIGARLFLSPKTVANNISLILDKLQLAHRGEAIIRAREARLGRGTS